MLLIREIMYCKPGKVRPMVEKFLAMSKLSAKVGMPKMRVMTDFCAERYWTLVTEMEVASMDDFERMGRGGGEYHLFAYSDNGGGGIRPNNPPEVPGSIPYVHVADTRAAFETALREGAEEMFPPERVMEGVTIAIVRAPGGVAIGFSGP